jgi:site-specific recombinase XerD
MVGAWWRERQGQPEDPAFPNIHGGTLSRDAIDCLLTKYTHLATRSCAARSSTRRSLKPLHHGVDRSVIALRLGHESVQTPRSSCGHALPRCLWLYSEENEDHRATVARLRR